MKPITKYNEIPLHVAIRNEIDFETRHFILCMVKDDCLELLNQLQLTLKEFNDFNPTSRTTD